MMAPGLTGEKSSTALDLLLRALSVVAVFSLVGPPVGGLVAWLAMGLPTLQSPLPFMSGSYPEALPIAAGTGLLVALAGSIFGRTTWVAPIVAALIANLVFHGVQLATSATVPIDGVVLLGLAEVFLPPSIVASLVCWLLTPKLLDRGST
jgi:hypothetical protein